MAYLLFKSLISIFSILGFSSRFFYDKISLLFKIAKLAQGIDNFSLTIYFNSRSEMFSLISKSI